IAFSFALGLISLIVVFFRYYYLSGQEEKVLHRSGLYGAFMFELLVRAALLLMMLVGVSALSTFSAWSRPVLLLYAALMFALQGVDLVLSAEIRQQYAAGPKDPAGFISPISIMGYMIFIGHTA